jgi:transcriptional regulator with XRE-family HTH domain
MQMYDFSILRELRKQAGMNIANVAKAAGVSASVVSKLERNQSLAELETLYRLGRVFSLSAADLLRLAERPPAEMVSDTEHCSGDFTFREINLDNMRCLYGSAPAGAKVNKPEIHKNCREVCWVIKGKVRFILPYETLDVKAGESIRFDALYEHTYEAIEDCSIFIIHLPK